MANCRGAARSLAAIVGATVTGLIFFGCGGHASPPPVTLTSIRPNLAFVGMPTTLTLTGSGFSSETAVSVNGESLPFSAVNSNLIEVAVPASALAAGGTADVTVGAASQKLYIAAPGTVAPTDNGQVALYSLSLPEAAQVAVEFGPDTHYGLTTWTRPVTPGTPTQIFVAGMRANVTYHIRGIVTLPDGSVVQDQDQTFTTQGLDPSLLPALRNITPATGSPSGGVELLVTASTTNSTTSTPPALLNIFVADTAGNILWYYSTNDPSSYGVPRFMPNGDIAVLLQGGVSEGIREVNLAGDTVHEAPIADINAELQAAGADFQLTNFSHDVLPLPNGHVVVIGTVAKILSNLQCCPGQPTALWGDALVDFDPSWHVDWYWNPFDHLDPNRIVNGFGPYPPDWTHANALNYTADHDLLLSMRHQSWIVKIDYEDAAGTGDILWRLGYQGDFSLAGGDPSQWFYGQHMPDILSDDGHKMTLAVFDDGDYRVIDDTQTPPVQCGIGSGPACYSRAVIYNLDQDAKTAQQVWEFKPGLFSFWGGDVHQLINGNLEANFSVGAPGPDNGQDAMVFEVAPGNPSQVVWSMQDGMQTYRAYRLPSFYPGVRWSSVP